MDGITPILFLDVDGVLNSERWFRSGKGKCARYKAARYLKKHKHGPHTDKHSTYMLRETHIDPYSLSLLNQVLRRTDARIVVSSTWRLFPCTLKALATCGIDKWDKRFLGITPSLHGPRGMEIQAWMTENKFTGEFAILDDDGDMAHLSHRLVQTSWRNGMRLRHRDALTEMLLSKASVFTTPE